MRAARRLLGVGPDTEDVVQDVFEVALRQSSKVRQPDSLRSWLIAVTTNHARSLLRRRLVRAGLDSDNRSAMEASPAPGICADDWAMIALLANVLKDVPAEMRVAWLMHRQWNETNHSVAQLCRCSERTIKRRVAAVDKIVAHALG